jgi:hypothetical protein
MRILKEWEALYQHLIQEFAEAKERKRGLRTARKFRKSQGNCEQLVRYNVLPVRSL